MFLTCTFCRRGGAGGNFAQGHQDIKICTPLLLSGGAGGNFSQVWDNWQIETVNLSFKVCMHGTVRQMATYRAQYKQINNRGGGAGRNFTKDHSLLILTYTFCRKGGAGENFA